MIKNFRQVTEHVFRGAALDNRQKSEDIENMIKENHISLVIDFRCENHLSRYPEQDLHGTEYVSFPLLDYDSIGIGEALVDLIDYDGLTPKKFYQMIKNDESSMKRINYVLDFIEKYDYSKGNIYIHCSAGKDRTGIVSALLLKRKGYSLDYIYKDYLKSNKWFFFEGIKWFFKVLFERRNWEKAIFVLRFFIMSKENIEVFVK